MKKRSLILPLAALTACLGSACLLGGVYSGFADSDPIVARTQEGSSTSVDFGSGTGQINFAGKLSGNASDSLGTDWNLTISGGNIGTGNIKNGTKSGTSGLLIGSSSNCAESVVLVGTLPSDLVATSVNVNFIGNASGSKGTASVQVGDAAAKSGSISGTTLLTVSDTSEGLSGSEIKISVTDINAGFIISTITYTTGASTTPTLAVDGEFDVSIVAGSTVNLPLKSSNLPEGVSISANTENNDVATASISESNDSLIITGATEGTTTYTVTAKSGDAIIASCTGTIRVSSTVSSVSVTSSAFNDGDVLELGKSYQLNASVLPEGASQEITWSSSDDAAIVDDGGLLRIVGNSNAIITITATSAVDATKSGTISFTIDDAYEVSISDLLTNDGTTFANSLASGTTVTTKGAITAFDGTSAYIQSGDAAVLIYTSGKSLSSFSAGDGVKVTGTIKIDNGLVKIGPTSVDPDDSAKEEVAALELNNDALVSVNTSRLVKATKAVCLESKAISGASGATKAKFKFEGSESSSAEFVAYIAKDDLKTLSGVYGDFEKGATYNLSGIFYKYVSGTNVESRFVLGSSFGGYENEDLRDFIATYITEQSKKEEGSATCANKYSEASEALSKLSEATQNTFKTASAYKDAYEVYSYWETHKDVRSTAGLVSHASASDWRNNLVAIVGSLLLVGGATFFFAYNGKKKKNP